MFTSLLSSFVDFIAWLASGPGVVLLVAFAAATASRFTRFVLRGAIRRLARRSVLESAVGGSPLGLWRVRIRRPGLEGADVVEQRRRQRIDAATRMVNHLVSLGIWLVAAVVVFHLLEIDPAFFLSGAGFLGMGLAIGGQHRVNDYLTGLSVHFEDRYGTGDELVVDLGSGDPVRAVVDHIGLFSTRLRDADSTMHVPNASLGIVCNLSQEAVTSTLRIHVPDDVDADDAAGVLRGLAGTQGLTDVVFVGDVLARPSEPGVVDLDVRTGADLAPTVQARLTDRVEDALRPNA